MHFGMLVVPSHKYELLAEKQAKCDFEKGFGHINVLFLDSRSPKKGDCGILILVDGLAFSFGLQVVPTPWLFGALGFNRSPFRTGTRWTSKRMRSQ